MDMEKQISEALAKFEALIREQLARNEKIKAQKDFVDFDNLDKIVIGVCGGDGIGPIITKESAEVLKFILKDDVESGKIVLVSARSALISWTVDAAIA